MSEQIRLSLEVALDEVLAKNHHPATAHERRALASKLARRVLQEHDYPGMVRHAKKLTAVVEAAKNQFAFYADQHRQKGTEDGLRKARVNEHMVTMCVDALTGYGGYPWNVADMLWNADDPEQAADSVSEFYSNGEFLPGQVHQVQAAIRLSDFYVWCKPGEAPDGGVHEPGVFLTKEAAELAARRHAEEALTEEGG